MLPPPHSPIQHIFIELLCAWHLTQCWEYKGRQTIFTWFLTSQSLQFIEGGGTASYEFMRMTSVNRRIWDVSEVHLLGDHFLQQVTSKFISKEWGLLNQNKANCHPRNSPFQKGHRMDSDIQYVHVYKLGINASPTNQFFQKVFQSRVFKFMLLV